MCLGRNLYKELMSYYFIMYKQAILIRKDLKLPKGKMSGQAAHASVEAVLKSDKDTISLWRQEGQKKIVLLVEDEKELIKYLQHAKDIGIKAVMITDAGKTVIAPGTRTALAIGPDEEDKIDCISGKLKLA